MESIANRGYRDTMVVLSMDSQIKSLQKITMQSSSVTSIEDPMQTNEKSQNVRHSKILIYGWRICRTSTMLFKYPSPGLLIDTKEQLMHLMGLPCPLTCRVIVHR